LIPLEIWEVVHRPTYSKAVVLVANVLIVWYLIIQLKAQSKAVEGF